MNKSKSSLLKRPWCWERLKAGGEGYDRGLDGWMASLTQWTWVWVNSESWWWTGRPGVLPSKGRQRVRNDWATELNSVWNLVTKTKSVHTFASPGSGLTTKICVWLQKHTQNHTVYFYILLVSLQFSSVHLLSHVRLFVTSWTAACQASLSITNSWSLPKLMSIE